MTVRHVFIMEWLALMIYYFLCIVVVHGSLCSPSLGHQKCVFFLCVKTCARMHGPLVGGNPRAAFCSQSVTDHKAMVAAATVTLTIAHTTVRRCSRAT